MTRNAWLRQMVSRAACLVGCLSVLGVTVPASGGIISDRSAFVGDFTVIDFETRVDGTPIDLEQGGFIMMDPDEYASLGVNITTSRNFWGTDQPWIGNGSDAHGDAVLDLAGSPENFLSDGAIVPGILRFDFVPPVNALGMVLMFASDSAPVIMSAYSSTGVLLDSVEFSGSLVDGAVPGVDFGNSFDFNYGFVGIFSPNVDIAYAELASDRGAVDDLHFGNIPEPTTIFLLAAGLVGICFVKRRHWGSQIGVIAITAMLVFGTAGVGFAQQEITGNVTAWVVDGPEPICGDFGPLDCNQVPLTSVPLPDTKVCIEGGSCVFTDENGNYSGLFYSDVDPVNVQAFLEGRFGGLGFVEITAEGPIFVFDAPFTVAVFDPNSPTTVDIALNPNHTPVLEGPTAEANLYYHFLVVRDYFAKHFPTYSVLQESMGLEEDAGQSCANSAFNPVLPAMGAPRSGGEVFFECTNLAFRDVIAQLYGLIMLHRLFEGNELPDPPFIEGFNAALAVLLYDYPILMQDFQGEFTSLANFDFDPPTVNRTPFPCADNNDPDVDAVECRKALGGTWWDIKLNMQAKYNPQGQAAPDCPIDPSWNGTDECGLEVTRKLFFDWIQIMSTDLGTEGSGIPIMMEILEVDDDDGDLWNGSPNFTEICTAFRAHGIDCPFDCNEDGVHDLDNIAQGLADSDENQIPEEECLGYKIIYVDAAAGGFNDGSTWFSAYTSLWEALQAVQPAGVDEIWVAAGRYTTFFTQADPNKSFVLADGLRLYGGFAGGESTLTQRDPVQNETILSGDLNGQDCLLCSNDSPECDPWGGLCIDGCCALPDNGENTHIVVVAASNSSVATLLDGFTITAGNGSSSSPGGMFFSGSPTVRNCQFVGNFGGGDGGGAVAFGGPDAKPLFRNCRFENNSAQSSGGAVFFDSGASPRFVDCWFVQNSAGNHGGAVASLDSAPTFIRCNFEGNSALQGGGGLTIQNPGLRGRVPSLTDCEFCENDAGLDGGGLSIDHAPATLSGCSFVGNDAGNCGGGMYSESAEYDRKTITDCFFGGNTAVEKGGAIYNRYGQMHAVNTLIVGNEAINGEGGGVYATESSQDDFTNCTISDNRAATGVDGDGVYLDDASGSKLDLANCILWRNHGSDELRTQDDQFYDGPDESSVVTSIIDDGSGAEDPLFRNPPGGDYRLPDTSSPAKDAGTNSSLPAGIETDLDGGPRIYGPIIDRGAYEWSDCHGNSTDDGAEIFLGTSFDCDNSGIPDDCEIAADPTLDCPSGTPNGIPDHCEADCQAPGEPGSGSADSCDISNGTSSDQVGSSCHGCSNDSPDCDSNGGLCVDGCCVEPDNGDGIPDECQLDCNGNQIPDEFDLAGNDCNVNGIPDGCDDDSDLNGIPDDCANPVLPAPMDCDSHLDCTPATSIPCTQDSDCAGTAQNRCSGGLCGCPGGADVECGSEAVCDPGFVCWQLLDPAGARCSEGVCVCPDGDDATCWSGATCISDVCYVPRNKYVSFQTEIAKQNGNPTAYRLKLIASASLPGCVGESRWVGVPAADGTALLLNEWAAPFYWASWPPVVHIGDELIAPDSTYEIVAVFEETGNTSAIVEFPTAFKPGSNHWGDVVGAFDSVRWSPPNGSVNMNDLVAAIKTFIDSQAFNATHVSITDVAGWPRPIPNRRVTIYDVVMVIFAFRGDEYPWKVTGCNLPWRPPTPAAAPPPSTLSLALSSAIVLPDETVDVEVFLDYADNLTAYQVALEVTTEGVGTLDLESRFITDREDYVFDGMNSLEVTNNVGGHIAAFDMDGDGVGVSGPVYLGTFRFKASSDANGVFHIGFQQSSGETLLASSDGGTFESLVFGNAVDVDTDCDNDVECDDGNGCTDDTCVSGACSHVDNDTNTCTDGNDCTDDTCSSGVCVGVDNDTNTCTDGNECTDDSCSAGVCVSVNDDTNTCTDSNDCTYDDACLSGVCTSTNEPVGTSCDDGLFCTKRDECDGTGTCVGIARCFGATPFCCEYLSICGSQPCS